MIHVVKEKRLNDFKQVHCVQVKDLFSRLGSRVPNTEFTSSDEPIPMNMSKIDSIEYLESYDARMQAIQQSEQINRESGGAEAEPTGKETESSE